MKTHRRIAAIAARPARIDARLKLIDHHPLKNVGLVVDVYDETGGGKVESANDVR